jgi:hypothetical protein
MGFRRRRLNFLSIFKPKFLGFILYFIFFAFTLQAEIRNEPIAVYLSWQRDPTTTMIVQWVSSLEQKDDEIFYKQNGENSWQTIFGSHAPFPEGEPFLLHRAELTGLTPNSVYFFRPGGQGKEYKFRTMPTQLSSPLRFVVGGDMYHDDVKSLVETNRQAAAQDPYFALVGGDIAYARSESQKGASEIRRRWLIWLIVWKQHMVTKEGFLIPMLTTIGNHDTDGKNGQTPKQASFFYFLFPFPGEQGCNVLDFGNYLSIFALDTGHTHPIPGAQTFWLHQTLQSRWQMPHKLAFYHVPAFPSVRDFKEKTSELIRQNWVPIFERFGLSTAFEHHDHAYKRTHPLYQGKTDYNKGVLYMGDGAWGVKNPRTPKKPAKNSYLAVTAAARHFIMVTLSEHYRYYHAIDYRGKTLDAYIQEIVKEVPEKINVTQ